MAGDKDTILHDFKNLVQWRVKIENDLDKVNSDFVEWSKSMDKLFSDMGVQIRGGDYGYLKLVEGEKDLFTRFSSNSGGNSSLR